MKIEFSTNDEITIYPNEKGWTRIFELKGTDKFYTRTEDNGYKDQLWCIIQDLHSMFYNGQDYFEHTSMIINSEIK